MSTTIWQGAQTTLSLAADGLAIFRITQEGAPFNTLGAALHRDLAALVAEVIARSEIRALLMTSGKPDFVVGADISEFGSLFAQDEAGIIATNAPLQSGFSALADLRVPVVVAIGGMALGGGLELALCADARVVSEKALLGVPEVKLGLFPGLGGTVRLPRLTGVEEAMKMIASGAPVPGAKALAIGLADELVPAEELEARAGALALRLAGDPAGLAERRRLLRGPVAGAEAVDFDRLIAATRKASPPHQPAAVCAAEMMENTSRLSRDEALQIETARFAALARSQAANALTGTFFAERQVKKAAQKAAGDAPRVSSLYVLGAGIMGGGIAWTAARAGMEVRVKDISEAALQKAMEEARRLAAREVARGRLSEEKAQACLARIRTQTDDNGADQADLVIEAVVEKLEVKRQVLAALEPLLRADAVIATNTSSLRVGDIAAALADPGRLVGMHFFNPVPVMPLLEVVRVKATRPEALALAVRCGLDLKKTPVVVSDCPGFLVNRILTAYINAFTRLVAEGVDFRAIDRAMEAWGWPMGPALLEDVVGMDTGAHVIEVISAGYPERMAADYPDVIAAMARAGRLGQKSGAGFYAWSRGSDGRLTRAEDPQADRLVEGLTGGVVKTLSEAEITERLMLPTLLEAICALEEGVVGSAAELDQALLLGIGFPAYAGGALRYADWIGAKALLARAEALCAGPAGAAAAPPALLREKARDNGRFYG
ncbi:3-hydroxyacyl-CoA dehydrogenase NAD-binding domain-containing protein [Falsigemmobacter intermedius]|uniref:enoyl-CoA hydratase n=1 Tax=Falsigemmobacter intermedius TaxID=1553448 RepID=A0A3S3YHH1_9RHOB|nr:3-hydroxyacyl-CoA dehydrogenase NAD-binding domain-containing protein [Falsigemmobacter intermedius]RWY40440.1 fatty acid oxidation complex subunit alpha FadB [Falsigemmobacter intermedius]